jgi:hypothetical protein
MKLALRRILVLGVVMAILAGGALEYRKQTRPDLSPLGAYARRVVAFDSAGTRYWWLDEHEVMLLRGSAAGEPNFVRHNIDTATETPLPALSQLFRASAGKLDTLQPAPTGDWALWTGDKNTTFVATLDGRRHYRIQEPGPRHNIWMYVGNGWYAVHLDVDTISLLTERYLDDPLKPGGLNVFAASFHNDPAAVDLDHIASAANDRVLVPLWTQGKGNLDRADIGMTGIGANPQSVKKLSYPRPYPNSGGEIAISPWANQLAWRLDIQLPRARFWNDLGFHDAAHYSVGFWVTDLATGRSVSYGYLEADRNDPASRPTNLKYSPVGKYFSYVYRNALWVISTE